MTKFSMAFIIALVALPSTDGALAETKSGPPGFMHVLAARPMPNFGVTPDTVYKLTGTFKIKITATVGSYIASNVSLGCTVDISPTDEFFFEDVSTLYFPAVRSGATATCDISLPYTWDVSSLKNDTVFITYDMSTILSSVNEEKAVQHESLLSVSIPLPKTGATTTIATRGLVL